MSDWRMKCSQCNQSSLDLKRCSRCYTVYYCSRKCQRLDWSSHKKSCTSQAGNQSSTENKTSSEIESSTGKQSSKDNQPPSGGKHTQEKEAVYHQPAGTDAKDCQDQSSSTTRSGGAAESMETEESKEDASIDKGHNSGSSSKSSNKETDFAREKGHCMNCHKLFCSMTCAKCKSIYYCSKACQKKDWPVHKKHCKKFLADLKPEKDAAFTEKEEVFVDMMRKRQQRFNETRYGRASGFWFGPNYAGAADRLLHSAVPPNMLKIHERPSGSLPKVLRYARTCFPGWTVIDDFQDIPHERSRMEMFQELQKQSMRNVLVAFMFMYHDHVMRHGVFLKDSSDNITHVEFYFDHIGDNPWPHFTYADVRPGNYILIQNPLIHQFMDGQVGLRINDPAEVKICIIEGLF